MSKQYNGSGQINFEIHCKIIDLQPAQSRKIKNEPGIDDFHCCGSYLVLRLLLFFPDHFNRDLVPPQSKSKMGGTYQVARNRRIQVVLEMDCACLAGVDDCCNCIHCNPLGFCVIELNHRKRTVPKSRPADTRGLQLPQKKLAQPASRLRRHEINLSNKRYMPRRCPRSPGRGIWSSNIFCCSGVSTA